jgi:hypothetical protein
MDQLRDRLEAVAALGGEAQGRGRRAGLERLQPARERAPEALAGERDRAGDRRVARVGEDRDVDAARAVEAAVEVGREDRTAPTSLRSRSRRAWRSVATRPRMRNVCVASISPASRRERTLAARSRTAVGTWRTSRLIA